MLANNNAIQFWWNCLRILED